MDYLHSFAVVLNYSLVRAELDGEPDKLDGPSDATNTGVVCVALSTLQ